MNRIIQTYIKEITHQRTAEMRILTWNKRKQRKMPPFHFPIYEEKKKKRR